MLIVDPSVASTKTIPRQNELASKEILVSCVTLYNWISDIQLLVIMVCIGQELIHLSHIFLLCGTLQMIVNHLTSLQVMMVQVKSVCAWKLSSHRYFWISDTGRSFNFALYLPKFAWGEMERTDPSVEHCHRPLFVCPMHHISGIDNKFLVMPLLS